MSKFDRSKVKATPVGNITKQNADLDEATSFGDKIPFHDTSKNGSYTFRTYPAHPDTDNFSYPYTKAFLPFKVKEVKDGEETGKIIERKYPVKNSKVHGGTKKDIVEEYIDLVYAFSKDKHGSDSKAIKADMEPISKFGSAIRPSTTWVIYADLVKGKGKNATYKFGKLELKYSVKNWLDTNAMEGSDDPLDPDPYSDPDSGVPFIIKRESDDKGKNVEYTVMTKNVKMPISDERLETWFEAPSLESLYKNVYTRADFEKALEGLEVFDEKFEMGIFGTEEWDDIVNELSEYYPEEEEGGDDEVEEEGETEEVEEEDDDEDEDDDEEDDEEDDEDEDDEEDLDSMDRKALKAYIKLNDLPIRVKRGDTDDDIRDHIRDEMPDKLPWEEEEGEEEEVTPKSTSNKTTSNKTASKSQSSKERLEAIRKRVASKKKTTTK